MKKIIIFTFLCLFSSFSFAKVEWFSGSVEEAFKEAAKKDKLVYLYWGAAWCPPCNLLKKRVFSTKDFQKTMENFIPVYLDGDEKRAQIWGEKFKIGGYPTTLVLDGSKQELLRLSTGSSVDEYTDHLKSTLKKRYSLKALTQKALLAKASREEWKALEGFSWYEEEKLNLLGENKLQGLKTLYLNSPRQFKEKFFLIYLDKLAKDKPELSKKEKEELAKKYDDSILIENTINAYMEDILFGAKDHLNFLFEKKALKQREEKLQDLLIKYRKKSKDADELLTTYALFAEMEEPLSKKDQKELADIVFKVEAETKDPYLYHSSMSTGLWLLKKSEQDE
ncbi:MAG: thioredoxin family protein, partial [Halobacteriovoraceae bacterium]|nr:thioredoxin family protein [Halobacteriovoraceae bacterium]